MIVYQTFPPGDRSPTAHAGGGHEAREFLITLEGSSLRESWVPMPFRIHHYVPPVTDPPSDFFWFGKTLVFTSTVIDAVGDLLRQWGEILPLDCDTVPLWVFNPLLVLPALDEERSELTRFPSTGRIWKLIDPVWHPEVIGDAGIFKEETVPRKGLFCTERFVEPVRAAGLRGLRFGTWQSEAPDTC